MNEILSVKELNDILHTEDLILLDTSLPSTASGKTSEYESKTIPGARFFDLKQKFTDTSSPFPNTIPTPAQFELGCQKLGIKKSSHIVVFDNFGVYSSPRVWWLFKVMGHSTIQVLDGGLPEWIRQGYETTTVHNSNFESGDFQARYHPQYVKSYTDIVDNLTNPTFDIIDARSAGRFAGVDKEPRKHLKSGHIPSSFNLPFKQVLKDGKFKSVEELKLIFQKIHPGKNDIVYSCGSGLTACIIMLASHLAHKKDLYLYDGSWSEWAERQGLKEETQNNHKK